MLSAHYYLPLKPRKTENVITSSTFNLAEIFFGLFFLSRASKVSRFYFDMHTFAALFSIWVFPKSHKLLNELRIFVSLGGKWKPTPQQHKWHKIVISSLFLSSSSVLLHLFTLRSSCPHSSTHGSLRAASGGSPGGGRPVLQLNHNKSGTTLRWAGSLICSHNLQGRFGSIMWFGVA